MTQDEILSLEKGDKLGFKNFGTDETAVPATVLENGNLLIVQIDGSPTTIKWNPFTFPDGIPQLVPAPPASQ